MDNNDRSTTPVQLGTWSFLRAGWWVLHIVAIAGIFWLGYIYGSRVFG